jgi:hypothetical protein
MNTDKTSLENESQPSCLGAVISCKYKFMEKCKAKSWFVLKKNEHGRDDSNLILTPNSEPVFWYYARNKRVELMMEFWEGLTKEKSKYIYKASIGNVSIEEFNTYFEH